MPKSWDIVGYTFNAENYCPTHVIDALPTGPDEAFDGWKLAEGVRMSTEDNLRELALAFGINYTDERTYDSSEFPKVIFRDQARWNDTCATCDERLDD